MLRTTLTLLLGLTASLGAAGEPLTLEQAVATAIEGSPVTRAARASANAAASRADQARGHRLPRIDVSEVYHGTDIPAEAFAQQLNQRKFDFEGFFQSDPNNPDFLSTWMTSVEVEQPIYTGGELGARIGQASEMAAAEELTWQHAREQVGFDTVSAFVGLTKAREYEALLRTARDTTARHVELARMYADQGMILESEVLKAEVYLAEVDEMLANASSGARLAESALNFQLGTAQDTPRELAPLPPGPVVSGELGDWIDTAADQRQDLSAARRQLEAGRLEVKASKSGYLPRVGVIGRYTLYGGSAFGDDGHSGSIMAAATINLFRGGSDSARLAAARHQASSFEVDVERFESGVELEVRQAWQELTTARARLKTATDALAAAREALRVTESRFGQGLDRMIDLLDAETALRESETRELVARFDVTLNTYRLYFASGASLIDLILPAEEQP